MHTSGTDDDSAITRLPQQPSGGGEAPVGTAPSGILGQLQHLIGQIVAAPISREAAATAAELAAQAAEKAGPAARSLAVRADAASQSFAERATRFASEMRPERADAADPGAASEKGPADIGRSGTAQREKDGVPP